MARCGKAEGTFADRLCADDRLASMVAHRRQLAARPASHGAPALPLPERLEAGVRSMGVEQLYSHQAEGLDLTRAGRDVLAVTPTASGKTLLFALAALESILDDRTARALFVYPTKALAQDQLGVLRRLASSTRALDPPRVEIYDGDTPHARRKRIRADPPNILLTNPDMLHAGILAHHEEWAPLLSNLRYIVLDELHVYRGLFGAHVHHILARLLRLCARSGATPQCIAASATIGNPAEFARRLVGRPFSVVETSGAPRAALDVTFLNPVGVSPYTTAVRVVAHAVEAGQRTIAFTKSRRITELLHSWLVQHDPSMRSRVAPYRAGYLPQERRAIEARLFEGSLAAVLTTSALELGIDVGGLDLCVLVGYPGSLISSWQRIGRVGRAGRPASVVFIAMPDSLDQYVVHHPELFFGSRFEKAVLDPWNPLVAGRHLECAAAEAPLERPELEEHGGRGSRLAEELTQAGRLVQDAAGARWYSFRRRPHRDVSPRGLGTPFRIVAGSKMLGAIDGVRVWRECHPGAIYLHGGRSYEVLDLDEDRRRVVVREVAADYYTVVLGDKETAILERDETRTLHGLPVGYGSLRVTVRVRGYQKRRLFGGEPISSHPLELPPSVYETVGFWIELPPEMPAAVAERSMHFMGGIHATEHAMIGLFPLMAIADRGDVAGISYTGHPQLGRPAIFVYDGLAGGAGLSRQGFDELDGLVRRTRDHVTSCPCEDGCPACIQSPQCGNGNKPLDKAAASLTLDLFDGHRRLDELGLAAPEPLASIPVPVEPPPPPPIGDSEPPRHGVRRAGNVDPVAVAAPDAGERVLVLDVETQRSAEEVGGWGQSARMGLALAIVWDARRQAYRTYYEADVHQLLLDLVMADRVIGFNIDRFDLQVLSGYTDWDLARIRTFDMLADIRRRLGFRISLNHLSEVNLGESKSADGLQSLRWWKEGRIDLIEQYCRKDVEVTRRLYDLGRTQGFLLYRDHSDRRVRLPVSW